MIGAFMSGATGSHHALRPATLASAFTRSAAPYAALGLAVAAISALALGAPADRALGTGVRVAFGALVLRLLLDVARKRSGPTLPGGLGLSWSGVVAVTLVLLVATLQRSPSRLIVNLLGYGLAALPSVWLARRFGGAAAATRVAWALAVFVLVPAHVDWRAVEGTRLQGVETPFVWSAGWPSGDSVLRHEVVVPAELNGKSLRFFALLAERYTGASRVVVSGNGQALGAAELSPEGDAIGLQVPAGLVRGGQSLALDLRLQPYDSRLRLVAHRWTGGASRGAAASSYLHDQRWLPGTFAAVPGRAKPGAYLVRLTEAS